ncbi:hypothetical protein GGR51DRAFT_532792 [Nemania sp. FL0031]|nr:hypothetical protein GGR51DRAFT_532792 [Nemania sp. FL0031]
MSPEPTQQKVKAGLFDRDKDNQVAARMNQIWREAWMRLTRVGLYPFLAHLLDRGLIKDSHLYTMISS